MALVYSKERLSAALKIFREARENFKDKGNVQRHLRSDYEFRRINAVSFDHATAWDDDNASSDEYTPATSKKRRLNPRTLKSKPPRPAAQPANPLHTKADGDEVVNTPCATLVTLKLKSYAGRLLLNALTGSHGKGSGTVAHDDSHDEEAARSGRLTQPRTYFAKKHAESVKIDEHTTRSGLKRKFVEPKRRAKKIPDNNTNNDVSNNDSDEDVIETKRQKPSYDIAPRMISPPPSFGCRSSGFPTASNLTDERKQEMHKELDRAFPPGRSSRVKKQTGSVRDPIYLDSPESSPTPEPIPAPLPKPVTTSMTSAPAAAAFSADSESSSTFTIRAPWAYPFEFKHARTRTSGPCHFCEDFRYGIYGYGLIEAEVFKESVPITPTSTSTSTAKSQKPQMQVILHEAGTGHRAAGKEATRMCVRCALTRLSASRCKTHKMVRFGRAQDRGLKVYTQQLVDKRFPATAPKIARAVYHTCALCCNPAFHRCVADQTHNAALKKLTEQEGKGKGCGLLLCESCAENLIKNGGVLKKTTVQKRDGPANRRADIGFLFPGSMLHKAYY